MLHIAVTAEAIPEAAVTSGWTSRCGLLFRMDRVFKGSWADLEGADACFHCVTRQRKNPKTSDVNGQGWIIRVARGRYMYNPRLLALEEA